MRKLLALADRTAVLFLGIAAGAAIGFAFGRSGERVVIRTVTGPAVRSAGAAGTAPSASPSNPAVKIGIVAACVVAPVDNAASSPKPVTHCLNLTTPPP